MVKPQTLVLIPGLNNTAAVFDRLQSCLREVDPSIQPIALDNPALESVDAIAQAHLQRLPDRFWLAGFSFGGYVAMALLAIAPAFRHLTLPTTLTFVISWCGRF